MIDRLLRFNTLITQEEYKPYINEKGELVNEPIFKHTLVGMEMRVSVLSHFHEYPLDDDNEMQLKSIIYTLGGDSYETTAPTEYLSEEYSRYAYLKDSSN